MEIGGKARLLLRCQGRIARNPFTPSNNLLNHAQVRTTVYERYRHGPNRKHQPKIDQKAILKEAFTWKGVQHVKRELKWFIEDSRPRAPPMIVRPFEFYPYEHFDTDEAFNGLWKPLADSDTTDGFSRAYFERSPLGHGLFHGHLDTRVPDDGIVQQSGFVALAGPKCGRGGLRPRGAWNFDMFTHILMRVRGDGRTYRCLFNTASENDDVSWYDNFSFPIYTHGGPYWQDVKLPFSRFVFSSKSYIQDYQFSMPKDRVKFIAITLSDNIDGPFRLEIDYIGLTQDFRHKEVAAYEHYGFDFMRRIQKQYGSPLPDK